MLPIIPPNGTSPFDRIKQTSPEGIEYWSARDLQAAMGYDRWERFTDAMDRAMTAALNTGAEPLGHFRGAAKITNNARGQEREVTDFHLTRFAAYLTAMNGDPRKEEIASAQAYFAVQTRNAEIAAGETAAPALPQDYEEALEALLGQVRETKALTAKVAELEPAATSWNVLATADGDFSVADAAKILARDPQITIGQKRLFTLLAYYRWTYRQGVDGRPRAMQSAIETGRLSELPSSHYHPRTGELVLDAPQVRVTVKGLNELHKRLGGSAPVQVPTVPAQGGTR